MIEDNQNLEYINENSTALNTNVIVIVSDLLRVLENEWYSKLKENLLYTNMAHNIFSLLNYQITLIQQLSEYNIETYISKEIEPIISFNKNIISKKIEKIIYFNDNEIKRRYISTAYNTQNTFYNKKNINNKAKKLNVNTSHQNLYYKQIIPNNEKKYSLTKVNDNSRNYLENFEENNNSLNYLLDEKSTSEKYLNTFNSNFYGTNNNTNNTFNNDYSINLIQKNGKEFCENPVRKVKNIIINAKQKNCQSSSSSLNKIINKEGILKILPEHPNTFYASPINSLYQFKYDKDNYLSDVSSINNLNTIKCHNIQDLENNEKLILKVETIKDRGTKEILHDGMKNIKKRLKSKEKNKNKTGINLTKEEIKYFLSNKQSKNKYNNNKQKKNE